MKDVDLKTHRLNDAGLVFCFLGECFITRFSNKKNKGSHFCS